jgi:vacuolar protein sorting-associated protein 16
MVGPLGDTVEFPVSPPVVLVPERDGVRVVSDERHELLRRVPAPLADVYRVGSTTPGDAPRQSCLRSLNLLRCCGGCR